MFLRVDQPTEKRTYAVLVDNEPGVLARVVGLFAARGYNIESLTVAETMRSSWARICSRIRAVPEVTMVMRET